MTDKIERIFDSDIDEDIVRFVENLGDHLERVKQAYPENTTFLDAHFNSEEMLFLASQIAQKIKLTRIDNQEHSFAYSHQHIWYQACTIPREIDKAREWFVRIYGGYSKLITSIWNSTDFKAAHCKVFYHLVYGCTKKGGWVHMTMIPMVRPSNMTTVLPIEFLTKEEQKQVGIYK